MNTLSLGNPHTLVGQEVTILSKDISPTLGWYWWKVISVNNAFIEMLALDHYNKRSAIASNAILLPIDNITLIVIGHLEEDIISDMDGGLCLHLAPENTDE